MLRNPAGAGPVPIRPLPHPGSLPHRSNSRHPAVPSRGETRDAAGPFIPSRRTDCQPLASARKKTCPAQTGRRQCRVPLYSASGTNVPRGTVTAARRREHWFRIRHAGQRRASGHSAPAEAGGYLGVSRRPSSSAPVSPASFRPPLLCRHHPRTSTADTPATSAGRRAETGSSPSRRPHRPPVPRR